MEFKNTSELYDYVMTHNLFGQGKKITIIYSQDNWNKPYTEVQRTYTTNTDQKCYDVDACGTSMFGDCLDGTDLGIRLDWYRWKAEKVILHI